MTWSKSTGKAVRRSTIAHVTGSENSVPVWLNTPDIRWGEESEAVACERLDARALVFVGRLLAEIERRGATAVFVVRFTQPQDVVIAFEQDGIGIAVQIDEEIEVMVVFDEKGSGREFGDWAPIDDRFDAAFQYLVSEYLGSGSA
jgi:hypothetical protein